MSRFPVKSGVGWSKNMMGKVKYWGHLMRAATLIWGGGYLVLKAVLSLFTACFAHSPFTSPDSNRNERRFQGHGFLKRRLLLQNGLKENDVRDIFAHGEPLVFDKEDFPRLIVPKIVEVCRG